MAEAPEPQSKIRKLLSQMEKLEASDLHIKSFSSPLFRIHGVPRRIESPPLNNEEISEMIKDILHDFQLEALERDGSIDLALSLHNVGRFRVNVFRQRGNYSICARRVNTKIPAFDDLYLPKVINRIPALENGIVLVVGAAGSGKSTTLASIISKINTTRRAHILTIEDPIEYVYHDDKSFINQREVGLDVDNFHVALKYALRQDPDVILVGELRDSDTIETALAASETGHLVFGTLHANNSLQTISRLLDFFPAVRQNQVRQVLAFTLRAVIAQKLIPGCKKGIPRIPAVEIMFVNGVIKKLIHENEDNKIPEAIRSLAQEGFQDFNMSLFDLERKGFITKDVALDHSPNAEQLRMNFKGMVLNQDSGAMSGI